MKFISILNYDVCKLSVSCELTGDARHEVFPDSRLKMREHRTEDSYTFIVSLTEAVK